MQEKYTLNTALAAVVGLGCLAAVLYRVFLSAAVLPAVGLPAALFLTVFNELVRLEQRRGADLAAEKADALIPCQQLEHVVQRGTLHTVDICLYQLPRRLPHPARTDSVGQGQQQPRFVGQYALLALPCGLPKIHGDLPQLFIDHGIVQKSQRLEGSGAVAFLLLHTAEPDMELRLTPPLGVVLVAQALHDSVQWMRLKGLDDV